TKEADTEYRQARSILEKLAAANPKAPDNRHQLAKTLGGLGDVGRRLGRAAESRQDYSQAIDLCEVLVRESPEMASYRSAVAFVLRRRGQALATGANPAGAAADTRRALDVFDALKSRSGAELFETACCHAVLSALAGREGSGVPVADGPLASTKAIE